MSDPKRIAAVVTEYRRHSHADVIVGKILEGYNYDGGERPALPSRFPVRRSGPRRRHEPRPRSPPRLHDPRHHRSALTLGNNHLSVEGVLCIGEHGHYPTNARGQVQYPRRRFFEAVTNVLARERRTVPVFSDKHLAATWSDAKWMYDRARELFVPFMAGSSVPVTWRRPPLRLPLDCDLVEAVQIGYGPFEGYGFHALEGLQCLAERRRGGETGVRAVQCVQGEEMWRTLDRGVWSRRLLEAAMERVPAHARGDYRTLTSQAQSAGVFLIEYRDGFKAAVAMLNGWVHEGDGGAFCFAGQVRGQARPVATQFYLQQSDPFAHFSYLVRAIERMMQTGHAPWPVERTLLTTGILEAVMISRAENNRRVETPHLDIRYQPVDWPFATDPVPAPIRR